MVSESEVVVVCQKSLPVLDVKFFGTGSSNNDIEDIVVISSPISSSSFNQACIAELVSLSADKQPGGLVDVQTAKEIPDQTVNYGIQQFVPIIRSGSCADVGPRRSMEDEHICIDDLESYMGSLFKFPKPSGFYGVFDGHGGPEAAAYVRENVIRLFFEDVKFTQTSEVDSIFLEEVENSLKRSFLLADLALADDCKISSSSGTTAIAAFLFGRILMVANAGDCRAVLCRKGEAIDMSQDHRPTYLSERRRVEELGGFIDDGYLNGVLSVTRALGDWDMKLPRGSSSPLIAEPEFRQVVLTEDDEFLIIGCDGIWDVMSSQQAVSLVRRGLRHHHDPEQSARDLVMEALRLDTFDNLTAVVVCFSSLDHRDLSPARPQQQQRRSRCCSITPEALSKLRKLLDGQM